MALAVFAAPPALAPVTAASVVTDRPDYVLGMAVTATARFDYSGPFSSVDEAALVEWFNDTWVLQRAEYVPKTRLQGQGAAEAVAIWAPAVAGTYYVNASSNTTNGTPPLVTGSTTFRVRPPSDYVIARGIAVSTNRTFYELGWAATATANLTAVPGWVIGNVSRLERVQFNWYYPSGGPARLFANVSVANGEASDSWTPDILGADYRVSVTYLGNDTVSNETLFPVFPASTPATNVSAGQTLALDAARSPWRVCGDLVVAPGGTLTIEADVTVKFCRNSRLIVQGTLTADGSLVAPVRFTSYVYPPAPGDWRGIRFEAGTGSRVVHAIVEYVSDGIVAVGTSPLLVGVTARLGTGEALNLTESSSTVRDAAITGFWIGVGLWNATSLLNNVSVTSSLADGVRVVEGDVEVRNSRVEASGASGVAVLRGTVTLDNVTLLGNWRHGLYAYDATGVTGRDVRASGGNYSLRALGTSGILIERLTASDAAFRSIDLTGSTAILVNSTIASAATGQDFLLVASTATLRNSTFVDDPARRTIVSPSSLVVENYLTVRAETSDGTPLSGVQIEVTLNGVPSEVGTTDPSGGLAWIVVTDRVITAGNVSKNSVTVSVSLQGYTFADNARAVDMGSSRTETFVGSAVEVGVPPTVAYGGLLVAAFLLAALLLLWRRRKPRGSKAGEVGPGGRPKPTPGTSYVLLSEKPDAAFEEVARAAEAGSPALCLTRIRPEDAWSRFGLRGVPVYWLSRSLGRNAMNPTNLGAIVDLVRKRTADHPGCRVLVDGMEYLYTQNDFGKVVKFVQALADVVAENQAVLYLSVDPKSFDSDRLAILTRDLRTWS